MFYSVGHCVSTPARGEPGGGRRDPALSPLNLLYLSPERFSSLRRLLRITACTLKAADRFKEKIGRTPLLSKGPFLSCNDLEKTRTILDKAVQEIHFGDILNARDGHKTNLMVQLGLEIDKDGLIRCRRRLFNAKSTYVEGEPKLLPEKDPYTNLVVMDCDVRKLHAGTPQTLAEI